MTEQEFWRLIELPGARLAQADQALVEHSNLAVELLKQELAILPPEALQAFQLHLDHARARLFHYDVLGVMHIFGRLGPDFELLCNGLLLQGRNVVEAIAADPEVIADREIAWVAVERLDHIAADLYAARTGRAAERFKRTGFLGETWREDVLPERFPRAYQTRLEQDPKAPIGRFGTEYVEVHYAFEKPGIQVPERLESQWISSGANAYYVPDDRLFLLAELLLNTPWGDTRSSGMEVWVEVDREQYHELLSADEPAAVLGKLANRIPTFAEIGEALELTYNRMTFEALAFLPIDQENPRGKILDQERACRIETALRVMGELEERRVRDTESMAVFRKGRWVIMDAIQTRVGDLLFLPCTFCETRRGLFVGDQPGVCPVCQGDRHGVYDLAGVLLTLDEDAARYLGATPVPLPADVAGNGDSGAEVWSTRIDRSGRIHIDPIEDPGPDAKIH